MFWLLLATGLTGGLTLVYAARLVSRKLWAPPTVSARFPKGGCTDAIVAEVASARREVLVMAYGFTSRPIAEVLIAAKMRGVQVEIVLDHSNEHDGHSDLPFLLEQGLSPVIDAHHAIAHNKLMLIDGHTIITGSFNFTNHAETSNAENLLILKHHHDLAAVYRQDFEAHKAHARAPEAKATPAAPPEVKLSSSAPAVPLPAAKTKSEGKAEDEKKEKPTLPIPRKEPPARAA